MTSAKNNSNTSNLTIRSMTAQDIDTVITLERQIFPDPWPRSAFEDQIEDSGWYALVAEIGREIIGYACYMIVAHESHLTNVAVIPAFRRKLVAKRLLDTILQSVNAAGCEHILLEVRPSNEAAIAFYDKNDFQVLYRRPNYYRSPVEDALVMVKKLHS